METASAAAYGPSASPPAPIIRPTALKNPTAQLPLRGVAVAGRWLPAVPAGAAAVPAPNEAGAGISRPAAGPAA